MTGWENFGLHYRLQSVVVGIVMDLSIDLMLDDLMLVGLDNLVCDRYCGFGQTNLRMRCLVVSLGDGRRVAYQEPMKFLCLYQPCCSNPRHPSALIPAEISTRYCEMYYYGHESQNQQV